MIDSSPMPFGKYKYMAICRVPAEYLIRIYDNRSVGGEIFDYIHSRIDAIRKRMVNESRPFSFPCSKRAYYTEKIAKAELKRIINMPTRGKKPIRTYECLICGGWHLTSQPLKSGRIFQEPMGRT